MCAHPKRKAKFTIKKSVVFVGMPRSNACFIHAATCACVGIGKLEFDSFYCLNLIFAVWNIIKYYKCDLQNRGLKRGNCI